MISAAFELRRESASTVPHAPFPVPQFRHAHHAGRGLLTVEVRVPYVHEVDALAGEARRHLLPLLLDVEDEREEALDVGQGHVVAVRSLYEGLPLQIQDCDEARHE